MCRRAECPQCGRPTFAGCGAHIASSKANTARRGYANSVGSRFSGFAANSSKVSRA